MACSVPGVSEEQKGEAELLELYRALIEVCGQRPLGAVFLNRAEVSEASCQCFRVSATLYPQ